MIVTSEDRYASARLPIPDPNSLIVAGTHDPWVLLMELHSANVIKVAKKRKQTPSQFVVPYFDLVIIPYII